jgi:exonuclease SbcD
VDLFDLPLQVIALPWISRSGLVAAMSSNGEESNNIFEELEKRITAVVNQWLETANPEIPVILTAHGMVQGAELGSERTISLGADLIFPGAIVKDPRLAYSALGHIHKYQDLNRGNQPPVVYPGSIERVDFGEVNDDKGFVIATIEQGKPTGVERRIIAGRRFLDKFVKLDKPEEVTSKIQAVMPSPSELDGSIFRLTMDYPRSLEPMIDEPAIRLAAENALEFHLARKVRVETRSRVGDAADISSLAPEEQMALYWRAAKIDPHEIESLNLLARSILSSSTGMSEIQE